MFTSSVSYTYNKNIKALRKMSLIYVLNLFRFSLIISTSKGALYINVGIILGRFGEGLIREFQIAIININTTSDM